MSTRTTGLCRRDEAPARMEALEARLLLAAQPLPVTAAPIDAELSALLANWHADVTGDADGGLARGERDGVAPVDDADLSILLATWPDRAPIAAMAGTTIGVNGLVAAGKATLSGQPYDIGSYADVFDGNTSTLCRSANVNPWWIQVTFDTPKTVDELRVWCSHAGGDPAYRWQVETADNMTDMNTKTGSYAEVAPWTETPSDQYSAMVLPAPATATIFRLRVERLTGDNYVHLNEWELLGDAATTEELAVTPASETLMRYGKKQFQAIATDSDGVQTDVTGAVAWSSTDPAIATVDASGLVTALAVGECEIVAELDGEFDALATLEVTAYQTQPVDLNVTYIERTPRYDYDAAKNNPDPGDVVTFRGHIHNWSDLTPSADYHWELDGQIVATGTLLDLLPDEERVVEYEWTWDDGDHDIKLVVDPALDIDETSEANNAVEDRTNGLIVGFWVEQSVYDYFHQYQHELDIGSNSWADWAQRQMAKWNDDNINAIYPDTPNGVEDRVRIDKITVVPDGALPLSGGYPTNNPDNSDKTPDLVWGFPATLLDGSMYTNHTSLAEGNAFYMENSLNHEMGHARYLIDNYGFDVSNSDTRRSVEIYEDGMLVPGSDLMPLIAWDTVLYYNKSGGIMTGPWQGWSPYEAGALNLIAGQRATQGNCNAPGNIGVFLSDLPDNNHVRFVDTDGNPLVGANVRLYQAQPADGSWYGKFINDTYEYEFTTDANGYVHMPRNPFSDDPIRHTYGAATGISVLRIESGDELWYRFMEVCDFNMEYWRGNTTDGYYQFELAEMDSLPEIEITGYGQVIPNGDTTPSPADHTDFGTVNEAGDGLTRQFVVHNRGGSILHLTGSRVQISGPNASDFQVVNTGSGKVWIDALAGFQIRFVPASPGLRTATVTITSDADESVYTFDIQGNSGVDVTPPTVTALVRNDGEPRPHQLTSLTFAFSEPVGRTISPADLQLYSQTTGQLIDTAGATVAYDDDSRSARWDLTALALPAGHYDIAINAVGITDTSGNALDGTNTGAAGTDYSTALMVCPPGDINISGHVNDDDLSLLLANWRIGAAWSVGDVTGDGEVDDNDLSIVLANWGADIRP